MKCGLLRATRQPWLTRPVRIPLLAGIIATVVAAAGVTVAAQQPARAIEAPRVAVVADSYGAGWTGTTRNLSDAWWQYTARDLGWTPGNIVANPGAGFVKRGDYGTLVESLRAHPISPSTDFVLVQGGFNDADQRPEAIPPAVAELLAVIHAQAPKAVPVVVGMFVPPVQGMSRNRLAVARRIGDGPAIGATRYMIAAMCDFTVGFDGVHPTATGHRQIGDWVAWHLAHGLDNGKPLHKDPTGTFYTTT